METNKLLANNLLFSGTLVNLELGERIGFRQAALLQIMRNEMRRLRSSLIEEDGYVWLRRTAKEWATEYSYIGENRIGHILLDLEKLGLIIVLRKTNIKDESINTVKFYRINEEALNNLECDDNWLDEDRIKRRNVKSRKFSSSPKKKKLTTPKPSQLQELEQKAGAENINHVISAFVKAGFGHGQWKNVEKDKAYSHRGNRKGAATLILDEEFGGVGGAIAFITKVGEKKGKDGKYCPSALTVFDFHSKIDKFKKFLKDGSSRCKTI